MKPVKNIVRIRHSIGEERIGRKIAEIRPCELFKNCNSTELKKKCEGQRIRLEGETMDYCGFYGI